MSTSVKAPDKRELRNFGLIMGTMFALLFGLAIPWLWNTAFPVWPWIVAGIFWIWGLTLPTTLVPVFQGWMKIALVLGWINTRLILGLVFFLIILPTGALLRLLGKDPMARRFESDSTSYRTQSTVPSREKMEKPF